MLLLALVYAYECYCESYLRPSRVLQRRPLGLTWDLVYLTKGLTDARFLSDSDILRISLILVSLGLRIVFIVLIELMKSAGDCTPFESMAELFNIIDLKFSSSCSSIYRFKLTRPIELKSRSETSPLYQSYLCSFVSISSSSLMSYSPVLSLCSIA